MSLQPCPIGLVPENTARVARAAFPRGTRWMRIRDELGTIFEDSDFASLFPCCGKPALSPWRLAVVTLLQYAEGLSDRQAADAVRSRIDWKYLLGLPLDDSGFDASVLSEFRTRLVEGNAEARLLAVLLERCHEKKLLGRRGRQRTDSTHVLSAVRALSRVECVAETTPAPVVDGAVVDSVHADLEAKDLLPRTHLADTGYIDAEQLVRSRRTYDVDLLGPTAKNYHWQAREKTGFQASKFSIDWERRRATCPAGHTSNTWSPGTQKGKRVIQVRFSMKDCSACAHKAKCTRARRRTLTLRPRDEHVALLNAREREKTDAYAIEYAMRAGVEGTISQATRTMGLRRSRYVGLAKTHLQHVGTAAALNLVRLADWFTGETPAQTRQGSFERLMAAPVAT